MYNIYTIKDTLAETYNELMLMKNDMVACRTFSDMCKNDKSPLYAHPENYTLYKLGTYDEESGNISADATKTEIAKATNYTTIN